MKFQNYQTLNNTKFQLIQKEKGYKKYLERIETIVKRKFQLDQSPEKAMKNLRLKKDLARKKNQQDIKDQIMIENVSLHDRIVSTKNREYAFSEYHSIDVSGTRRRQMNRINKQNLQIGMRLSKLYEGRRKTDYRHDTVKHKGNTSIYLKDRKLPLLVQQNEKRTKHQKEVWVKKIKDEKQQREF